MLDLEKIKPKLRGSFKHTAQYKRNDLVYYGGNTYICVADCAGVVPTNPEKFARTSLNDNGMQEHGDIIGFDSSSDSLGRIPQKYGVLSTLGVGKTTIKVSVKKLTDELVLLEGKETYGRIPEIIIGRTYRFDLSDPSMAGRVFKLFDQPHRVSFNLEGSEVRSMIETTPTEITAGVTIGGVNGTDGYLEYTPQEGTQRFIYYDVDNIGFKKDFWLFRVVPSEEEVLRYQRIAGFARTRRVRTMNNVQPDGWFGLSKVKGSTRKLGRLDIHNYRGNDQSYFLMDDGSVQAAGSWTTGAGSFGSNATRFVSFPWWFSGMAHIEVGFDSTMGLDVDGNLWIWGYDRSNYMSHTNCDQYVPYLCGQSMWEAYGKDGRFGGKKIVHCAIQTHTHSDYGGIGALTEDGQLYIWGYNGHGGAGVGSVGSRNSNGPFGGKDSRWDMFWLGNGLDRTWARELSTGHIYFCGHNGHGEGGVGHTSNVSSPQKVKIPDHETVITVFSTGAYLNDTYETSRVGAFNQQQQAVFFLCESGNLYSCGSNGYGWLGHGRSDNYNQTTPDLLESLEGQVKYITGSDDYPTLCVILKDGTVRTWGSNSDGVVGDGTTHHQAAVNAPTKPQVYLWGDIDKVDQNNQGNPEFVQAAFAGRNGYYALALLRRDGKVFTAGRNDYGTLGRGHGQNRWTGPNTHYFHNAGEYCIPTTVFGEVPLHGEKVIAIRGYAHGSNACGFHAITNKGQVYHLGGNSYANTGAFANHYARAIPTDVQIM